VDPPDGPAPAQEVLGDHALDALVVDAVDVAVTDPPVVTGNAALRWGVTGADGSVTRTGEGDGVRVTGVDENGSVAEKAFESVRSEQRLKAGDVVVGELIDGDHDDQIGAGG